MEKRARYVSLLVTNTPISKFYSRTSESQISSLGSGPSASLSSENPRCIWLFNCYCRGPEYGDMVGCDNPSCSHEWFHLSYLKLVSQPKSKYW